VGGNNVAGEERTRQAAWSRRQAAYLTVSDDEARRLMHEVPE
jgi:hypothetical protein